ncbi:MAG: hypothetical protein IJ224_11755 [Lachnospiraceae bacterium]|nr:hypothetical protein [Lachnospiraceae bacterium]
MKKLRIIIDMMMVALLPLLMAYSLIGEKLHEILGISIFALFIAHHIKAMSTKIGKHMNKAVRVIITVLFLLIAAYGVYVFKKRGLGDYLMMKVMFAFFDYKESKVRFLLDYEAIMVLFGELAYLMQSFLGKSAEIRSEIGRQRN